MFSDLVEMARNDDSFSSSIVDFFSHPSFDSILLLIMMIFMTVGGIDKIRGDKHGYGAKFDEGFNTLGPLAIVSFGVIAGVPVICAVLQPIIGPVYELIGASPAGFATTIIACDAGGYPLALSLAGDNVAIGVFAGLIIGSMMGALFTFSVPVAFSMIKKTDRPYLACGYLCGIVTIPIGCLVGGLAMNMTQYKMPFGEIIVNTIPIIIISGLITIGLKFRMEKVIRGFQKFGSGFTIFVTMLTIIAVFQYVTGIKFPLFSMMVEDDESGICPLEEAMLIIGAIAVVLIGAFPMVEWVKHTFNKALMKAGNALGIDEIASVSILASLANAIPVFAFFKNMSSQGKIISAAFVVSGAFLLGDHLGFVAGVNKEMILPVLLAKIIATFSAVFIAKMLAPAFIREIEREGQ